MKRMLLGLVCLITAGALSAETLDDWVTAHSTSKVGDLTVGDWKAFADARSIQRQEARYVHGSAFASFLLPGLGQYKTGDPMGGTLQLAGFAVLTGATLYGAWTLLPDSVKASGLSFGDRHQRWKDAWSSDPGQVLPTAGVLAAGAAASLFYRFWSSGDAREKAETNLQTGKVVFEPAFDGGFGFRMRM